MKHQLYLMRHAKAEPWSPLGNDFSRTLSERGVRDANGVAEWAFDNLEVPDTALCSPSSRTRQTLSPFLSRWHELLSVTDYVESIYGGSVNLLMTLMEDAFSYSERLLMVGHNPGFEDLMFSVLKPDQAAGVDRMHTGTMAVIGFDEGFRRDARSGDLLHKLRFKDL
jgi:phosphohistidine phosphatase